MRLQRNTSNIQVSAIITKFTLLKTSNLKIFLITLLRSITKSVSKPYVFNFVDVVFLFCSLVLVCHCDKLQPMSSENPSV